MFIIADVKTVTELLNMVIHPYKPILSPNQLPVLLALCVDLERFRSGKLLLRFSHLSFHNVPDDALLDVRINCVSH
jgi:hypothetical protein